MLDLDVTAWTPPGINELLGLAKLGGKRGGAAIVSARKNGELAIRASMGPKSEWRSPASWPVVVGIGLRYRGTRKRDADNALGAAKLVLDALVRIGWIPDDDARFVESVVALPQERGNGFRLVVWDSVP